MALSQKMNSMVDVIKKYDKAFRNNSDYKHYFAPYIPEKVIKTLRSKFDSHLAINGVVAFYDSTIFGSAKTGILFAKDGFYHKFMGKAVYVAYKDINDMSIRKDYLDLNINNNDISEYTVIDSFDMETLKKILLEFKAIDRKYGQSSVKTSGKVKKLDIPSDMLNKCNGIIHTASVACGGVGTGMAQIPASDNAVIVPIQMGMIVSLGAVFGLKISDSAAKSIMASAGASITGRTVSQFLVGWMPLIGNAINTATAAGVTEAIGWIAVNNFYESWINNSYYQGRKDGYDEASGEYEIKLRKQADEFLNQAKDIKRDIDEYEKLLDKYEAYIEKLESKHAATQVVSEFKGTYKSLIDLRSA